MWQERPRDATLELAKRLDCQGDTDEMVDCLRRTNVKDLINKANDMYVSNRPKLTWVKGNSVNEPAALRSSTVSLAGSRP